MAIGNGYYRDLLRRVETLDAVIGIFGLKTEELKTAVAYARKGFRVLCVDFRTFRVEIVNKGISFSRCLSDIELFRLVKTGKIKATTDAAVIKMMDFLTIFPTLLRSGQTTACAPYWRPYRRTSSRRENRS